MLTNSEILNAIEKAITAQRLLPSIYQTIGRLNVALRRTRKPNSKLAHEVTKSLDQLHTKAATLSADITSVLFLFRRLTSEKPEKNNDGISQNSNNI